MGLKTTNYKIDALGVTLDNAYAKINSLSVYRDKGSASFCIQSSRDDIDKLQPLEIKQISFPVDKNGKLFEQAYNAAKETVFNEWIDDIVEIMQDKEELK